MPSRKTTKAALAAVAAMPSIPKDLVDQFVTGPMSAEADQDCRRQEPRHEPGR